MTRIVNQRVEQPLRTMVLEHLGTGGKCIRARIALRAAMAMGLEPARAINIAAACELLHNATLVHDDLQDGDTIRRGQPTVWVKHGEAQAINVGDVLLMLSTLALENSPVDPQTRWYLAAAMTRRATETASGQSLELVLLERGWMGRDTYLRAARGKSGPFFALPIEAAALCAGHSPESARILGDASLTLGALYQVCDDILDVFGDKGRGQMGNDLREGKVSALTVADRMRMFSERHSQQQASGVASAMEACAQYVLRWSMNAPRREAEAGVGSCGRAGRYACSVPATGLGLGGMQGSRRTREFVVRGAVHVTFESNEVEVGVARSAVGVGGAVGASPK